MRIMVCAVQVLIHITEFGPNTAVKTPAKPGKGAVLIEAGLAAYIGVKSILDHLLHYRN